MPAEGGEPARATAEAVARRSYGKLFWFYWKVLNMPPHEIIEMLAVEGVPSRLNHAVPGEV